MTDNEYLLQALRNIPIAPDTVKRSDLVDDSVTGTRRIYLLSRIYAFPDFVLIAEDCGRLCFLTEEAKESSIARYMRCAGIEEAGNEDVDRSHARWQEA